MTETAPEPWLRGPVEGVTPALQPVAHALIHAREEVCAALATLDHGRLHARPAGAASCAFHVRHAAGSLERLFTYARGEALSEAQRAALSAESEPSVDVTTEALSVSFGDRIDEALAQLRATDASRLGEPREVGRARLPSTVLGLLFHGAEHTQRHVGQLITTARVVRGGDYIASRPPGDQ